MFEVTVEDSFAAGHYLRNYKGKCENPHGHNYKVRVTLAGKELDKAGLLLDFRELKEAMKPVIDRLDHQMINDLDPFKVLNPSAENLAKYFYDETNVNLDRVTQGRVRVKNVTVFETDTTTASGVTDCARAIRCSVRSRTSRGGMCSDAPSESGVKISRNAGG